MCSGAPAVWASGKRCLRLRSAPLAPALVAFSLAALLVASPCRADLDIKQVSPGIYRGHAPKTAADYQLLKQYGIKTVVDVRKYFRRRLVPPERQQLAALGIEYRSVPVGFFPGRDFSIEPVVAMMADAKLRPIYVHCSLGRDRVGLAMALFRVRFEGVSPGAAFVEFKDDRFNPLLFGLARYFRSYAGKARSPSVAAQQGGAGRGRNRSARRTPPRRAAARR